MNFYKEELIDHYKNPRNFGKLDNASFVTKEYNPSCGDSVKMYAILDNNLFSKISFTGKGCIISQATASMLIQLCEGKSPNEVLLFDEKNIINLIRINLGPLRIKCALLPLYALKKGISQYYEK